MDFTLNRMSSTQQTLYPTSTMQNHSSPYVYVWHALTTLLRCINDTISPVAISKKYSTDKTWSTIIWVLLLAWGVFVVLTYIRYTDLVFNKLRTNHFSWRAGRHCAKNEEQVGEQSPLVKRVKKKVRFADETTIVPPARDHIPT